MELADKAKTKVALIPGQKLCPKCRAQVNKLLCNAEVEELEFETGDECDEDIRELEADTSTETDKRSVDECFSAIGISPLKMHGLHQSGKIREGKREISNALECMKTKLSRSLSVDPEQLSDYEA